MKHHIKYGPEHIVSSLDLLRKETSKVKDIITPVIQIGAYHVHSESVLTSLLCGEREEDRSFALEKIIQLRNGSESGNLSVRRRTTPSIKLEATTVRKLIYEIKRIFTSKLDLDELKAIQHNLVQIPHFSIHTQSSERAVQEV